MKDQVVPHDDKSAFHLELDAIEESLNSLYKAVDEPKADFSQKDDSVFRELLKRVIAVPRSEISEDSRILSCLQLVFRHLSGYAVDDLGNVWKLVIEFSDSKTCAEDACNLACRIVEFYEGFRALDSLIAELLSSLISYESPAVPHLIKCHPFVQKLQLSVREMPPRQATPLLLIFSTRLADMLSGETPHLSTSSVLSLVTVVVDALSPDMSNASLVAKSCSNLVGQSLTPYLKSWLGKWRTKGAKNELRLKKKKKRKRDEGLAIAHESLSSLALRLYLSVRSVLKSCSYILPPSKSSLYFPPALSSPASDCSPLELLGVRNLTDLQSITAGMASSGDPLLYFLSFCCCLAMAGNERPSQDIAVALLGSLLQAADWPSLTDKIDHDWYSTGAYGDWSWKSAEYFSWKLLSSSSELWLSTLCSREELQKQPEPEWLSGVVLFVQSLIRLSAEEQSHGSDTDTLVELCRPIVWLKAWNKEMKRGVVLVWRGLQRELETEGKNLPDSLPAIPLGAVKAWQGSEEDEKLDSGSSSGFNGAVCRVESLAGMVRWMEDQLDMAVSESLEQEMSSCWGVLSSTMDFILGCLANLPAVGDSRESGAVQAMLLDLLSACMQAMAVLASTRWYSDSGVDVQQEDALLVKSVESILPALSGSTEGPDIPVYRDTGLSLSRVMHSAAVLLQGKAKARLRSSSSTGRQLQDLLQKCILWISGSDGNKNSQLSSMLPRSVLMGRAKQKAIPAPAAAAGSLGTPKEVVKQGADVFRPAAGAAMAASLLQNVEDASGEEKEAGSQRADWTREVGSALTACLERWCQGGQSAGACSLFGTLHGLQDSACAAYLAQALTALLTHQQTARETDVDSECSEGHSAVSTGDAGPQSIQLASILTLLPAAFDCLCQNSLSAAQSSTPLILNWDSKTEPDLALFHHVQCPVLLSLLSLLDALLLSQFSPAASGEAVPGLSVARALSLLASLLVYLQSLLNALPARPGSRESSSRTAGSEHSMRMSVVRVRRAVWHCLESVAKAGDGQGMSAVLSTLAEAIAAETASSSLATHVSCRGSAKGLLEAAHVIVQAVPGPAPLRECPEAYPSLLASVLHCCAEECLQPHRLGDAPVESSLSCSLWSLRFLHTAASRVSVFSLRASLLSPMLRLPCLLSPQLTHRAPELLEMQKDLFVASCQLMCACVRHRASALRRCSALLLCALRSLLLSLASNCWQAAVSDGEGALTGHARWQESSLLDCAEWLRRLLQELSQQKALLGKYSLPALAIYLSALANPPESCALSRPVEQVLRKGAFCLMDVCSAQDLQHLYAAVGSGGISREVLQQLKRDYELHHKFGGKV